LSCFTSLIIYSPLFLFNSIYYWNLYRIITIPLPPAAPLV